jgi:tetratricopeptide (TPR) repeat protein
MKIASRKLYLPAILTFALLIALAVTVTAQGRRIQGKVTDENGEPIQDVQITIHGVDFTRTFDTKTNKKGEWIYLLGIQAGRYNIVARKEGYSPQIKQNIKPELGEETVVDFQLQAGQDYKFFFEMTDEEREKYKEQIEHQKKIKEFSAEVKARFDEGVKFANQGMYAEAVDAFNKALEKDPKQPGILARAANAYGQLEKYEEALDYYQKAIDLSPTDPNLQTNKGVILSKMGKTDESQKAFQKAASLSPGSAAQNFYNIGVTQVNAGNSEAAAKSFEQAIEADPNFAEAYYQLGMCLSGSQDTIPAAVEALKKYVEIGEKPEQVEIAKQIIAALEGQ